MGKGYNNYMTKKPFHPGSKANIKRTWMAEQRTDNEKKKQDELKVQYEKEQELYKNRALLSTESKDKLELNFMYEAPPGAKRERQKEDDEPEYKFEWQRKYNAPREDYAKGNAEIRDQPFGIPVRNVRCIKCHKWGHINTDKECPLFSQASSSSMPTTSMDPLELMRQMREDGYQIKTSALGHNPNPGPANQQLVQSESDPEMEFLKSLSPKKKKKLLKKLNKLSMKQQKKDEFKKKKKSRTKAKKCESSDSEDGQKVQMKKGKKRVDESDDDSSSTSNSKSSSEEEEPVKKNKNVKSKPVTVTAKSIKKGTNPGKKSKVKQKKKQQLKQVSSSPDSDSEAPFEVSALKESVDKVSKKRFHQSRKMVHRAGPKISSEEKYDDSSLEEDEDVEKDKFKVGKSSKANEASVLSKNDGSSDPESSDRVEFSQSSDMSKGKQSKSEQLKTSNRLGESVQQGVEDLESETNSEKGETMECKASSSGIKQRKRKLIPEVNVASSPAHPDGYDPEYPQNMILDSKLFKTLVKYDGASHDRYRDHNRHRRSPSVKHKYRCTQLL